MLKIFNNKISGVYNNVDIFMITKLAGVTSGKKKVFSSRMHFVKAVLTEDFSKSICTCVLFSNGKCNRASPVH